jgi:hypothetical protein
MHALARTIVVGLVAVAVLATGVLSAPAQGTDPRVGTWKLNVAKSKYNPGPPPKSMTVTVKAVGKGETVNTEQLTADGKTIKTEYTADFDSKEYPISGAPNSDTVSLKRINARTTERTDKKGGKVTQVLRRTVSADGKTMTVTVKGKNAEGKDINHRIVFDKQ